MNVEDKNVTRTSTEEIITARAKHSKRLRGKTDRTLASKIPSAGTDHLEKGRKIEIELEGSKFAEWKRIGAISGLTSDTQIAEYLIQQYGSSAHCIQSPGPCCIQCDGPLSAFCARCQPVFKQEEEDFSPSVLQKPEALDAGTLDSSSDLITFSLCEAEPESTVTKAEGSVARQAHLEIPDPGNDGQFLTDEVPSAAEPADIHRFNSNETTKPTAEVHGTRKFAAQGDQLPEHLHSCAHCGEVYMNLETLRRHERKHGIERNLSTEKLTDAAGVDVVTRGISCSEAGDTTSDHSLILPAAEILLTPYACDECENVYTRLDSLNRHKRKHVEERKLSAAKDTDSMCAEEPEKEDCTKHRCDQCGKKYTHPTSLRRHRQIHIKVNLPEVKPLATRKCKKQRTYDKCGKMFVHARSHRKTHDKAKQLSADNDTPGIIKVCSETSVDSSSLADNQLPSPVADGKLSKQQHTCNKCGKVYSHLTSLRRHEDRHYGKTEPLKQNSDGLYACEKCDRVFHFPRSFLKHKAQHVNGLKPYICKVCNKAFKKADTLEYHKWVHFPELTPKSVCEICGKAVRTSKLKVHQRWHRDERPYVCNYCGKSYKRIDEWKVHVRTHTGERPFMCQLCGVSFASNLYLCRHLKSVHSDKKPYQCTLCPSAFKSSTELKKHIHVHKGDKQFECRECNSIFFHDFSLKRHMMTHTR